MKIFYFTGTGNSLYVAKRFNAELYSIPQVLKGAQTIFEDEKIGIIFPTYGLAIPNIVKKFIETITLKSPYIFVIMTCGNNTGDATRWITSFAKKHDINISYSNNIKMIGNHIPIVNIDNEKSLDKNIEKNINHLIDDINNSTKYINRGNIIGGLLRNTLNILKKFHPIDNPSNFSVNENCIRCNTCIKVCPRTNVYYNEKQQITFSNHCESCLSCVHNCPKKAIQVKGDKNPQSRFRNEHISLKEIINSNIQ